MKDVQARAILQGLYEARQSRVTTTTAWRWDNGVYPFPEAFCPFCKVVMRSPCIWKVSEVSPKLLGVVGPSGAKLVSLPLLHPHVHYYGSICMDGGTGRRATSAAEALFLAINPQSTLQGFGRYRRYGRWSDWLLKYFDHAKHDEAGLKSRARPKLFKTVRRKRTA